MIDDQHFTITGDRDRYRPNMDGMKMWSYDKQYMKPHRPLPPPPNEYYRNGYDGYKNRYDNYYNNRYDGYSNRYDGYRNRYDGYTNRYDGYTNRDRYDRYPYGGYRSQYKPFYKTFGGNDYLSYILARTI